MRRLLYLLAFFIPLLLGVHAQPLIKVSVKLLNSNGQVVGTLGDTDGTFHIKAGQTYTLIIRIDHLTSKSESDWDFLMFYSTTNDIKYYMNTPSYYEADYYSDGSPFSASDYWVSFLYGPYSQVQQYFNSEVFDTSLGQCASGPGMTSYVQSIEIPEGIFGHSAYGNVYYAFPVSMNAFGGYSIIKVKFTVNNNPPDNTFYFEYAIFPYDINKNVYYCTSIDYHIIKFVVEPNTNNNNNYIPPAPKHTQPNIPNIHDNVKVELITPDGKVLQGNTFTVEAGQTYKIKIIVTHWWKDSRVDEGISFYIYGDRGPADEYVDSPYGYHVDKQTPDSSPYVYDTFSFSLVSPSSIKSNLQSFCNNLACADSAMKDETCREYNIELNNIAYSAYTASDSMVSTGDQSLSIFTITLHIKNNPPSQNLYILYDILPNILLNGNIKYICSAHKYGEIHLIIKYNPKAYLSNINIKTFILAASIIAAVGATSLLLLSK